MAWRSKNNPWFSPRAVTAPVKSVVEVKTGPNSVRYESRLNTGILDQGLTYEDYKKRGKKEKKKVKTSWNSEWDEPDIGHKSTYAWSSTRWSNWSYTSSFLMTANDNDDDTLFVKEPENYLTPSAEIIKNRTNLWTSKDIRRVKELARVCYLKMIDDRNYIAEMYRDRDNGDLDEKEWDEKVALFDNVYETYIPGFTPLEQAIAVNYKYNDAIARKKGGMSMRGTCTSFEFRRSDYADPHLNDQVEMNDLSSKHKLEILNKVSIIGDLGSQFKVEKGIGEQIVPYSDITRKKIMRSYDQMPLVDIYQRMLPNFRLKLLTQNLVVNVPVQVSEKKQKIIILCDQSGSMNDPAKQMWVNALLMDRFRYVMKGEAEVFFSFFVHNPEDLNFIHVKNSNDVEKFWKKFSNFPSGSYTNIGRIVTHVANEIASKSLHNLDIDLSVEMPEILIINDGRIGLGV